MSSVSDTPPARGRSRHSTATAIQDLPEYEPPIGPLTSNAQRALEQLLQNDRLKTAQNHVQEAGNKVSNAAGDINEKLAEARLRHERYLASQRKRREKAESQAGEDADGDAGDNVTGIEKNIEEEEAKFREREAEVVRLTGALEEEIRRIVDSDVMLEDVKVLLGNAVKDVDNRGTRGRVRRMQLRRRNYDEDEDEEMGDDGDEDWNENGNEDEYNRPNDYSQQLIKDLESRRTDWASQSLTKRYSSNNTYVGFYRLVHDAKHPGDEIPPVPHSSTWFRHLEDPNAIDRNLPSSSRPVAKRTRHGARRSSPIGPNDDDDEVAIARESLSLKCPLTLVQFVEPVTSTKCPHSFEKEAILGMLSNSQVTMPAPEGAGRKRVKYIKCPVCEVQLTADDLKDDMVLVRRVRRMEERMARMDEDEDEDEESGSDDGIRRKRSRKGRQSGITLASDDDNGSDGGSGSESESIESERRPVRIKQEILSQSQGM